MPIFESVLSTSAVENNPDLPNYFVALSGVVQFFASLSTLPLLERLGRKSILLIGDYIFCALLPCDHYLCTRMNHLLITEKT